MLKLYISILYKGCNQCNPNFLNIKGSGNLGKKYPYIKSIGRVFWFFDSKHTIN